MRNSPIVGFDQPANAAYDASMRYRGQQAENWMGQGAGHEEVKGRGQHPGNAQLMWADAPSMTPLERLLEQQRLQRQTDPH
nr:hypothetical protein BaRGS_020841 [Batillaria attramentaria]